MKQGQYYLVFGDLHGRVLPAFVLAAAWGRGHGVRVAGILQVGDLGYWPEGYPLDEATRKYAEDDPSELGARLVIDPSPQAEAVFFGTARDSIPRGLWFTAGNHECFESLERRERAAPREVGGFPVDSDYYDRVWCIRDGHVETLPGNLRVGALWGVRGRSVARRERPPRPIIQFRCATWLQNSRFDVLLTHDSPREAVRLVEGREEVLRGGSEEITTIIRTARPRFAFFGHHKGTGGRIQGDFGHTRVFHLSGLELRRRVGNERFPEKNSVGVLRWDGERSTFEYVDGDWLLNCPLSAWLEWERQVKEPPGRPAASTSPRLPWVEPGQGASRR